MAVEDEEERLLRSGALQNANALGSLPGEQNRIGVLQGNRT